VYWRSQETPRFRSPRRSSPYASPHVRPVRHEVTSGINLTERGRAAVHDVVLHASSIALSGASM
jgi:hypothetical protein